MVASSSSSSSYSSSYSSLGMLYRNLISLAIQRCRMSDELCRLSVSLKLSSLSNPPALRISISDTGAGSSLEEFLDLNYARDSFTPEKWDGVISVATTSISDNKVYNSTINLRESDPTRRLTKLPSNLKNGVIFSGTEVSLLTYETVDNTTAEITCFLRKMLILKNPKVAIELVVGDVPQLRCENVITGNKCSPLHSISNIECLKSGFQDYILKHGSILQNICHSCFSSGECLKAGIGAAYCTETSRSNGWVVEVVIIISESSDPITSSCYRARGSNTEVLYFKDFTPSPIPQSSLNALTSIDWKTYGLTLRSVAEHEDGSTSLVWDNLSPNCRIDIAIHCYHKKYPSVMLPIAKQKSQLDRTLTRKALKLALDNLKEKNPGVLLSARATKICKYAPDLANTLAALILSSNDLNFKKSSVSLLGLESEEIETEVVEDSIRERIISVIELNDRKPQKSKETEVFLFEDDYIQEPDFMDEEYE